MITSGSHIHKEFEVLYETKGTFFLLTPTCFNDERGHHTVEKHKVWYTFWTKKSGELSNDFVGNTEFFNTPVDEAVSEYCVPLSGDA